VRTEQFLAYVVLSLSQIPSPLPHHFAMGPFILLLTCGLCSRLRMLGRMIGPRSLVVVVVAAASVKQVRYGCELGGISTGSRSFSLHLIFFSRLGVTRREGISFLDVQHIDLDQHASNCSKN
jgi:hypothetical protein